MKTVNSMKKTSAILVAFSSLTLAGLSLTAQAENDVYNGDNWLLAKYDANGDAQITLDEIASKKLNIFKHMDLDQDGEVSFKEYETLDLAKRKALLKSRFIKLDTDHDGRVTKKEYSSYMGMFASIDSNGDGTLTEAEINSGSQAEAYVSRCLWRFCYRTRLEED